MEVDILESGKLKENSIIPSPVFKKPKKTALPPVRTMPIAAQMRVLKDVPESVLALFRRHKISLRLREFGVPNKLLMARDDINDLQLLTAYMISEKNPITRYYRELLVTPRQQLFWLMAMAYKPNTPFCTFIASEENSMAGMLLAGHLANHYLSLIDNPSRSDNIVRWYRSLEFVKTKQSKDKDKEGCIIIQCKWPAWVDSHDKLLRCIRNIRAAYDNANVIFLIDEEDLCVVPDMLTNEPFGCFLKVVLKTNITPGPKHKRRSPAINSLLTKLKKLGMQ